MGTELANVIAPMSAIETVVVNNDLSKLTPSQRWDYYRYRCESLGLNPAARPFQYLVLQGKVVLYADKGCAEQLRALHKIRTTIDSKEVVSGILCVTVTAHKADGRTATDIGAVPVEGLKGDSLANAMKKAVTQGNRRATLALMGLGDNDYDDVEGVQRLDVNAVHDPKGLLPTDNAEPATAVVVAEGPVNWSDPDQWPAGQPETINCKMVEPVVKKASNGADYATVTIDDGFGVSKFGTFHASGIAAIRACVGKLCEAQVITTGKAFSKLLTLKEVTK